MSRGASSIVWVANFLDESGRDQSTGMDARAQKIVSTAIEETSTEEGILPANNGAVNV
jgi:hypothetical protein